MTTLRPLPLAPEWKERLGITNRRSPELYESATAVSDTPHALAIRTALEELGLSAVFCVQDAPTIAILSAEQYDQTYVSDLHGKLWNQGLASLLLVITQDTLRAFSLARKPIKELGDVFERRCLIATLHATADALKFRNFIYGAESGRLWQEHSDFFKPKERVDQVLLDNLKESHHLLQTTNLTSDEAQALLIQTMFVAYLEDRGILTPEYFRDTSKDKVNNFASLLATNSVTLLKSLFRKLKTHFNGDLFVAPCSFEPLNSPPELRPIHLDILARFRTGYEEMGKGRQLRFWGYNFRYIPIELVSAVYDRFLSEKEEERRELGAYYTPMFLADTVISQLWEQLRPEIRGNGHFLDPACGSGVFLVRSFQRLCEHWRATRASRTIRWDSLLATLQRVHGWDLNGSAVRVAVFSLYVALLEEVSPPDIQRLFASGKILPALWGKTLVRRDFFDFDDDGARFDVIVGNPPWTSRRGSDRPSVRWCKDNDLPMPGGEDAWAFVWKALRHISNEGRVAFLLPAMGFLHNQASSTVSARNRFFQKSRVYRVINFADLRFQLFEGASRPAALIIYSNSHAESPRRFEYWAPKADLNLRIKRLITLSSADKLSISLEAVIDNPLAFKQRLWMREPDSKLFSYLAQFPVLGNLIDEYGSIRRRHYSTDREWVIGQGFQPLNDHIGRRKSSSYSISKHVGILPNLPIEAYHRLAQPTAGLKPWPSRRVRRKGFEEGFKGPRILVPRGVETSQMRLRATYVESDLTFQDILQAITVPFHEKKRAKLLVALLNSRVAIWFAFHGTASFGSERPEVKQAELLRLPFPSLGDLPEPKKAAKAAKELVAIVDSAIRAAKKPFVLENLDDSVLRKIDHLAYQYFCLSKDEVTLIEDAIEKIIPATQPHEGNFPDLWKTPTKTERRAYATTLASSVSNWLRDKGAVTARLEAYNCDLGVLRITLDGRGAEYIEATDGSFARVLARISKDLQQPLEGNFQLSPDLRVFIGKNLYLVKPMQKRFWLKSAALADADAIAMDLQEAIQLNNDQSSS